MFPVAEMRKNLTLHPQLNESGSFDPFRFFGRSKDYIDIREINRKKTKFSSHVGGPHKNMRLKDSQAREAYLPSWAEE